MQSKYEQQVQYLIKAKDKLQYENEQAQWAFEKANEKYETLGIKMK